MESMAVLILLIFVSFSLLASSKGYVIPPISTFRHRHGLVDRPSTSLGSSVDIDDHGDYSIQWELFTKHHALGSWKGVWTTVDYMGDVLDETIAAVNLVRLGVHASVDDDTIEHTHSIAIGATKSDCSTCFESENIKMIPVAQYTPKSLNRLRFAACGMVNGPKLLKSGIVVTELCLRHSNGRVRVVFQHAPVWEQGLEQVGPPQGLKLFRAMYARETLGKGPPTKEAEATMGENTAHVLFYRPVSPFDWHKQWAGTSWTWGPQIGNRGWTMEELDEGDAWHGNAPVSEWNLRLPGGIFIQCPRVLTSSSVGLCRLAWLPNTDTLLRLEAGVSVLQPLDMEDDSLVGFEPPALASLRCDILQRIGDLDGEPQFSERNQDVDGQHTVASFADKVTSTEADGPQSPSTSHVSQVSSCGKEECVARNDASPENGLENPRDALRL